MLTAGDTGPRVLLYNGSRQQLAHDGTTMSVLYFDSNTVDFGAVSGTVGDRNADFRERSILDLFRLGAADGLAPREISRMRAEAHQRLIGPVGAFGYTLTALAFLLTGGFDRRGQLGRISGAVATLIVLEAAGLSAADAAGRDGTFVPLIYMVGLLPIAIGLYIIVWPVGSRPAQRRDVGLRAAPT